MQKVAQEDCEKDFYKGNRTMVHEQTPEIDLRDIIQIIFKRRKIVVTIFFTSVVIAIIYSLFAQKLYEVSMVIEPAAMSGMQPFEAIESLQARAESGAYDIKIIKALNLNDYRLRLNFSQPMKTQLLKISLDQPENQTDVGLKILAKLLDVLSLNYAKFVEEKQSMIDGQVKTALIEINIKENEIKLNNDQLNILAERARGLAEELNKNKDESARLIEKREALFERKEGRDDVATLLYTTTLQQNTAAAASMQMELSSLQTQKRSILNGIEGIKNRIDESRIAIKELNSSKLDARNITVIQEPLVSLRPVWPKKKQIVSFGGLIGLIAGLLAVAFIEQQEKDKFRSHPD